MYVRFILVALAHVIDEKWKEFHPAYSWNKIYF